MVRNYWCILMGSGSLLFQTGVIPSLTYSTSRSESVMFYMQSWCPINHGHFHIEVGLGQDALRVDPSLLVALIFFCRLLAWNFLLITSRLKLRMRTEQMGAAESGAEKLDAADPLRLCGCWQLLDHTNPKLAELQPIPFCSCIRIASCGFDTHSFMHRLF